jgi:PAS domain S-box-containing protein
MIDMRTVIFSYIISNAICATVITFLWLYNRRRFAGLGFWLADFILQFVALLLVVIRGILPDFLTMTVSNTLIVGGTLLLLMGLERFVGKRGPQIHNIILLAIFICVHTWFTIIHPSLDARNILFSLGLLVICSQCTWLLLRRVDAEVFPITRNIGIIFVAYCFISIVRILVDFAVSADENFFRSNIYDTSIVMMYQMLFIALTFSLFMMVNRRLVRNLELDLVERRQAEVALRSSEEKFFKAFNSSPDAIIITRIRDGQIIEVNEGFTQITGYSSEEALANSVIGLRLWPDPQNWDVVLAELKERQRIRDVEYDFRIKSGGIINTLYSAEIVQLNGEAHILSVVRDVTRQKRNEEDLHIRNSVLATLYQVTLDLINRHDVNDILQSLLEQIGRFLDAPDVSVDLLEGNDTLVTYAATPGQPLQAGDTMRRGEGGWLSWQAVDNGQPAMLEDYSKWEKRRDLYTGYPIHSIMIIPIHHRQQVIGTINCSRREEDKPFGETEIFAAQQLAQVVALVLDNARLYTQLQSELSERRRIEMALRESQENFQRYFDMGAVGMCVTSPEKSWIEVNDYLCRMLGYSREELVQFTWSELTHPDDIDADLELFNQVIAGGRDSYQIDKRFIRKDGTVLYTSLFVSSHRNTDGTVRYFLVSLIDITERRHAEAALLQLTAIEERQRLARDLHDSVNQSIHSLVLFSETLISTLEKNNFARAVQISKRLQESARQALKEARLMLYEMQPSAMGMNMDFIQDLETRLSTVERRAGVKAHIVQEGSMEHCPREWYENLFWITIEALNNALKHAQARNMLIVVESSPQSVNLEIVDDGIGFDTARVRSGGFGLRTMRERSDLLGGKLTIVSSPGNGSRVCFHADIDNKRGMNS